MHVSRLLTKAHWGQLGVVLGRRRGDAARAGSGAVCLSNNINNAHSLCSA